RERDDVYGETNFILILGTLVRLAADEPDRAREELSRIMGRWSRQGFHLQHLHYLHDQVQIDLYQGDGLSAWRRLTEHRPLVERSHLLRVQMVRIYISWARARSALAAAAQVPQPEPFLRAAEHNARAMWREGAGWGPALAQMVRAGAASSRGDVPGAVGF